MSLLQRMTSVPTWDQLSAQCGFAANQPGVPRLALGRSADVLAGVHRSKRLIDCGLKRVALSHRLVQVQP